jgi:hypothetical protein
MFVMVLCAAKSMYSETSILLSCILHFLQIYALFAVPAKCP